MGSKKKKSKASGASASKSKKPSRAGGGKQIGAAAASSKAADNESKLGVVPSEYNIQAQIDWLTAPPSSGEKKCTSGTLQPPPSKKPQRGFHHDVCDGCGEGECLMYCDKCPAAYHCICDDPPLPPEDYETIGVNWKCRKCRNSVQVKTEMLDDDTEEAMGNQVDPKDGPIKKIFKSLIPTTHTQNPVQFKLPKEYPAYDYPFPGTSRHVLKRARQRTSVVEVENGIVPKPTVVCFQCQLSCRVGALIQCDKCDLFFHLDCLDPPLTTIPTTVWICPLHVEPHLESTQLTSVALSERIKIWEKSEAPVNRAGVIVDFLKKAKKPNPMFRRKRPIPMLSNVNKVPPMVEACYENTLDLAQERFGNLNALAYVCEVEKLNVELRQRVNEYSDKIHNKYLPAGMSLVEQRAKLELLRSRNTSKLNHLKQVFELYDKNKKSASVTSSGPSSAKVPSLMEVVSDFFKENEDQFKTDKTCGAPTPQKSVETETTSISADAVTPPDKPEAKGSVGDSGEKNDDEEIAHQWFLDELKAAGADIEADKKALDELGRDVSRVGEILRKKAEGAVGEEFNGCRSVPVDHSADLPKSADISATATNSQTPFVIPESVLRKIKGKASPMPIDIVKSLPRKVVNQLAASHLKHLLKKRAIKESMKASSKAQTLGPGDSYVEPKIRLFIQIENTGLTIEICKRVFSIGSGDSCDFRLTDYVRCNRIEEDHAKVFYNSLENCFEILNYASTGITVNNVRFGVNAVDHRALAGISERQQDLERMVEKRIENYMKLNQDKLHNVDKTSCYCKPFPAKTLPTVYEGSVKLHAGNRFEIGCARLVIQGFTVT